MPFEIPSSRIRQLQVGFRREAGLLSYEPAAPSPPQPPTIRDAVAALDPGLSSSLRCERYGGGLLRACSPRSASIAVKIGGRKAFLTRSPSIPQSGAENFSTSLGWMDLKRFYLTQTQAAQKKGQDTTKSELVLSDLLDLVLKWPSDKEDVDENNTTASPSLNTNVLSLTGVDLDYIFPERGRGIFYCS